MMYFVYFENKKQIYMIQNVHNDNLYGGKKPLNKKEREEEENTEGEDVENEFFGGATASPVGL